jgi:hypothetical protein
MKPFVIAAIDYHDFKLYSYVLGVEHNTKINYKEISCGFSKISVDLTTLHGCYHAIMFENGQENSEQVQELEKSWVGSIWKNY